MKAPVSRVRGRRDGRACVWRGGLKRFSGCNKKSWRNDAPEFLTGTSPGDLGIARTPETTSPIRRPPLDTYARAGRTPQHTNPLGARWKRGAPLRLILSLDRSENLCFPTVRFFQTENQSSKPSVSFGNLAEGEEAFILGHARPQGRPHSTSPPTNGIARCSKQAHQLNTRHDTT